MNFHVVLVFAIVTGVSVSSIPIEEYELKFVTFVHRHGDRSPVGSYPNDPYGNESFWNNGWGQLTNVGKQNAYNLGRWLRARYADFLPKIYSERDYEVESTDVSRTLMSAYLVLAGLYEPTNSDIWNSQINWQPIPVHTTPKDFDNKLAASKPCSRHSLLKAELMKSNDMMEQLNAMAPALSEIMRYSGYNVTNLVEAFFAAAGIYDSLFVQSQNGLQIPKWTLPYFPQPLQGVTSLLLRLPTYNRSLQRLSCGLLLKEILNNFKLKSKGLLSKKMWQYSAHDITVVGLGQCLNLNEVDSPPYTSALILELRSIENEFFVRVLYKAEENLRILVLPGCVENCPLKNFEELVTDVLPEDWDAECQVF